MKFYKGKKVWITGASSGIGKALALQCAEYGAHLILSARNLEKLEEVKLLCSKAKQVDIIGLDLADHDGLDAMFKQHQSLLSEVDVLINNGGISQRSEAWKTDFSVYRKLIEVNYLGTVKLSLLLLPYFMKRNTGTYVVLSSSAGKFGVPVRSGYSGSKFALHGFFEALRAELSDTNIGITMICPGFISTDISKNALTEDGSAQGTMDDAQANGMSPKVMAKKTLEAVSQGKAEFLVGGFKETKMAVWVSRHFPSLFRKIIAKSKVT